MCGIYAVFNSDDCSGFSKLSHRGPDNSKIVCIRNNVLGFHRLSIIDESSKSNQPIQIFGVHLVCNGEIFNYKELDEKYHLVRTTGSDCETVLRMYLRFGIRRAVQELDGEFAFVIYDERKKKVIAGRDPFGVRPLFVGKQNRQLFYASEAKAIISKNVDVEPFRPGTYSIIDLKTMQEENRAYFEYPNIKIKPQKEKIKTLLTYAVQKRLMSDRPVGCLLSGGLDSSLVAALVNKFTKVDVFTIGLNGSIDVAAAKRVAKFLKVRHHVVDFTVEEGFAAIPEVIHHLESYDVTTVRASVPQYLLAKYISKNTNIKVLFSGEGADELMAGYQYSKKAPNADELQKDSVRLLKELYLFDNLRTDRTMAAFGLEVRVPYLDKDWANYMISVDPKHKMCDSVIEKALIRSAFHGYLPHGLLYRRKEAFSDAVSSKTVSWYGSVAKKINEIISDADFASAKYEFNPPLTKEALYYRRIFNESYPDKLIPHYWLPKWQPGVTDPSATALDCHEGEL